MWLSSRLVLVSLLSLLGVFVGVQSDSKTYPLTPEFIFSSCAHETLYVNLIVDGSNSVSATQFTALVNHAQQIADGLFYNGNMVELSVFSSTLTSVGRTTTVTQFNILANTAASFRNFNAARSIGAAIQTAAATTTTVANIARTYSRRVLYVITTGPATDNNAYNAHKAVETSGIEVFVEAVGVTDEFPGEISGFASWPNSTHFITNNNIISDTVNRAVSSIRRDIGGTCSVFSGANIITLDGVAYSPSASGYNVLTQTLYRPNDPEIRTFSVVADILGKDVTVTTNADTLRFVWNNGVLTTTINGAQATLGPANNGVSSIGTPLDTQVTVQLSQLSAGSLGMVINVTSAFNDFVQIGFYDAPYVVIQPANDLFNHLVGLCGTWDSCTNNEFVDTKGTFNTASSLSTFVNSWSVPSYTYNTALWSPQTSAVSSVLPAPYTAPTTVADNSAVNEHCVAVVGFLAKLCSYDVGRFGVGAAPVYQSVQASICEEYCQSSILSTSLLQATNCDQYCLESYPPFDLHNITEIPMNVYDVQTIQKGQQKLATVYIGGTYVVKATDPQGIVDYTSLQFNCSEDLENVTAGDSITVTRSPIFGFPEVQLQGKVPRANRPIQVAWKAVSYPYIGMYDNTTSQDIIDAQAPVIISGTSLVPRFTPFLPGTYIFTIAAYDGCMLRYSNVTVQAVCDQCLYTARINPAPTSFWQTTKIFPTFTYTSEVYAAPKYPTPEYAWNITRLLPYNVRNENITIDNNLDGSWTIYLTTGTLYPTINTSTVPVQILAQAVFTDALPFDPEPITLTTGLVVHPTPATIEKTSVHRLDYIVITESVNIVSVPLDDFLVEPVCDVRIQPNLGTPDTSSVTTTPYDITRADYCTGRYEVSLNSDDICHSSNDTIIAEVQCNSRPILNAPACRGNVVQIYDINNSWQPEIFDGLYAYDTEEVVFTHQWTQVSRPLLSSFVDNCTTQTCTIQPDTAGTYVYTYTVSDGCRSESATYTLNALCQQVRYINQTVDPKSITFDNSGQQVTFDATPSELALGLNPRTLVTPPADIKNLPPFRTGSWAPVYNQLAGTFTPPYKGTWTVALNILDDCGILNSTVTTVTVTCPGVTQSVAKITPSTLEVETSGAAFPAISFDGTTSAITTTGYTATATYAWYVRPHTTVDQVTGYVRENAAVGGVFNWAPTSAGLWDVLLIYSDGCEYASTSVTVTAVCLAPVPVFEIDQTNPVTLDKISSPPYFFYGPVTPLLLNASQSVNTTGYFWTITTVQGDQYSSPTFTLPNNRLQLAPLGLYFPTPAATVGQFVVQLTATNQCPGGNNVSISAPLNAVCSIAHGGFLDGATFTADKAAVSFLNGNRFDSATFTANNLWPGELYFTKFLVTQAPALSIYAPIVETSNLTQSTSSTKISLLNNTGFSGSYEITTTTTYTQFNNSWKWVELAYDAPTNTSYSVCFTPDLPGTYQIHVELRDLCNQTYTKTLTLLANCPTQITQNFAQNITIDTTNFRDLARVLIDASGIINPSGADLKFRWALSGANSSFEDLSLNGTYYEDSTESVLTNYYGSVVSFVVPFTTYNNSYLAHYDIWDGCSMVSGTVNVTIPALSHRNIFTAPVNFVVNSTDAIKVDSVDSVAVTTSQFLSGVKSDLRMTDCYSDSITFEVARFDVYTPPPPPTPPKKKSRAGLIAGAVIGSVAGAIILGAAVFGVMKYKSRSVAV